MRSAGHAAHRTRLARRPVGRSSSIGTCSSPTSRDFTIPPFEARVGSVGGTHRAAPRPRHAASADATPTVSRGRESTPRDRPDLRAGRTGDRVRRPAGRLHGRRVPECGGAKPPAPEPDVLSARHAVDACLRSARRRYGTSLGRHVELLRRPGVPPRAVSAATRAAGDSTSAAHLLASRGRELLQSRGVARPADRQRGDRRRRSAAAAGRPADFDGAVGRFQPRRAGSDRPPAASAIRSPSPCGCPAPATSNCCRRRDLDIPWASAVPSDRARARGFDAGRGSAATKEFDWVLTPTRCRELDVPPVRYATSIPRRDATTSRRRDIRQRVHIAAGTLAAVDTTPAENLRSPYARCTAADRSAALVASRSSGSRSRSLRCRRSARGGGIAGGPGGAVAASYRSLGWRRR